VDILVHGVGVFLPAQRAEVLADIIFLGRAGMMPALEPALVFPVPPGELAVITTAFVSVLAGIPVAETVFPVPITATVIAVSIPNAIVAIPVAEKVAPVPVAEVAAQVFAVTGEAALVFAQLAPVVANIAVAADAARVQTAGALGNLIRAHGLEPVNTLCQFRTVDTLMCPSADDLPQTIAERRPGGERR
jgi:hypothetical protein